MCIKFLLTVNKLCSTMEHQGKIVEEAVRKSGIAITRLAKLTGYSRRHLYNMFQEPKLSIEFLLLVGKIIHHDFTPKIKQLQKLNKEGEISNDENPMYWKDKYLKLLEKHNDLVESKIQHYFKEKR